MNQEYEIGLQSISVPIRGTDGIIVAALNVCCSSPRVTREDIETRIRRAMLDGAQRIVLAQRLG